MNEAPSRSAKSLWGHHPEDTSLHLTKGTYCLWQQQIEGGEVEAVTNFIFLGSKITADGDCSHKIKRHLLLGRKAMTNLGSMLKSRDITLPTKVHISQSYGFSSMWELVHKEGRAPDNWYFQTVVLEKILERPLISKGIKPVNPKGNQPWMFIRRTVSEAPIFWTLDAKGQLTGKDLNARKDWRQQEKTAAEDEMVRWHHWLNGHEFGQTPGEWRPGKFGMLQAM